MGVWTGEEKMKILDGYKTILVSISAILIAVGSAIQNYYSGIPIDYEIVIEALIALALIFLRQGIKKNGT